MRPEVAPPIIGPEDFSPEQSTLTEQEEFDERFKEIVTALEEIELGKKVLDFAGIPEPELKYRQAEPGPFEAALGRAALGAPF